MRVTKTLKYIQFYNVVNCTIKKNRGKLCVADLSLIIVYIKQNAFV